MYKPFQNKYKKEIILNYGRPYTNYTTYTTINNRDNVEVIYVDKTPCICQSLEPDQITENTPYYVEVHYTSSSNIPKFETILKNHEIDSLIAKYGCKV